MGTIDAEKIMLFQETFKGRTDVVPKFWQSKDGTKVGYSPICKKEWKEGICKKPCRTCPNADYVPLSATLLIDHFKGRHILGVYPLLLDGTLNFIACDLDNHGGDREPLKDLQALAEVCRVLEIPLHALRSKSGKGYHAYLFFSSPVPAWKARAVSFALLREAQVIGDEVGLTSFDKLIPDQDYLDNGKKLGNLIALPFQGRAAKAYHTLFLDPSTGFEKTYSHQWEVLRSVTRWSEAGLDALRVEWNLERGDSKTPRKENGDGWVTQALQGVEEGARDNTGIKLAGYFTHKKIPVDIIEGILCLWNERNSPPLEGHEIGKIVSSVSRYEKSGDPTNEFHRSRQCRAID